MTDEEKKLKLALYKKEEYRKNIDKYKERARIFNKSEKRKEWKKLNKEKIAFYNKERWVTKLKFLKLHLKQTYGIDISIYNQMFKEQEGKCFGCKIHQNDLKSSLNVDHCHKTGKIRGLLCRKCNSVLGLANDNITILENLINYLKHE